jgi:threonine synthase
MRCVSTRGPGTSPVSLTQAIEQGLTPDGGLWVPESIPRLDVPGFSRAGSLVETATRALAPYFAGEGLAAELGSIVSAAFTFDAPVRPLSADTGLLELFHGPTAAFKDFGARFLAECLARLPSRPKELTILVATSGDTGAAVASAFHRRPGFSVVILYPDGRVSARQAHQLGAFGDNVRAYKVSGTFDDCQKVVKQALASEALKAKRALGSANSISLGRLLPQLTYYAQASLTRRREEPLNVVVPTGNLGNAMACLLAKEMGFPIGRVVLATNANRVLPDFLASGRWEARASLATLANAMDVGNPSNLERLRYWHPDAKALAGVVSADWVDDDEIRATIGESFRTMGVAVCPHTACGLAVLSRLRAQGDTGEWIVAATAHPAKFETVVEPLVGQTVPAPPALQALLDRPSRAEPLAPTLDALVQVLT